MAEALQNVVNVAAQAAQAAASAALSLEALAKAKEDKGTRYGEASKVIRMPDPFGSDLGDVETDQARWSEFVLGFKSWLFYADPKFEAELEYVETNNKTEVKLAGMSEDSKARSLQLFSILSGLLRGRPLRILRGLVDRNGIELWTQLNLQYAPKTKGRAFSILGAYMNYPSFDKSRSLLEHIQLLERVRTEYRKASGVELADDIQLSVLVRCLPKHIQQHVQLQLKEDSTYNDVRNAVLGYENVTQNWSEKKIFTELGVVQSYGTSGGGPAPMEIDVVTWKEKGSSRAKARTTRRASPRARDNGMVALVKEKVTRATRRVAMEKEKETGTTMDKDKVVLVVFKATVTIVTSLAIRRKIATS